MGKVRVFITNQKEEEFLGVFEQELIEAGKSTIKVFKLPFRDKPKDAAKEKPKESTKEKSNEKKNDGKVKMIQKVPRKTIRLRKKVPEKMWLKGGGKTYFAKITFNTTTHIKVGEVFSSFLLGRLGLAKEDFVKYDYAVMEYPISRKQYTVTLSENFIPEDALSISAYAVELANLAKENGWDLNNIEKYGNRAEEICFVHRGGLPNSVQNTMENLQKFCKDNDLKSDFDDIEFKMKRMVVLDYFFAQRDRHLNNVEFIIKDNVLTMAPIFDLERSFGLENNSDFLRLLSKTANRYNARTWLSTPTQMQYKLTYGSRLLENSGALILDILQEAKQDSRIKQLVDKCLTLDLDAEVEEYEKHYPKIGQARYNQITEDFTMRRQRFFQVVEDLKKRTGRKDIFTYPRKNEVEKEQ